MGDEGASMQRLSQQFLRSQFITSQLARVMSGGTHENDKQKKVEL